MLARLNGDGSVTGPMRAEDERGSVGDGMVTLNPGDAGYEAVREAAVRDSALAERWRFAPSRET